MVSFATAASNRDQAWVVIVTIEGIGVWGASSASTNGLWKFCSEVPTYAAGDTDYKPWLVEWPDMLSERVEILGGAPDAGELSVVILDGHDGDRDALTERLRTTARSVGYLISDHTAGTASINTDSDTPYTAGASLIFVGNEAMKVSAKPGGNILTATRACIGTEGQTHKANDRIYTYLPYAQTRRMRLYLTPKDGDSSADETQVGQDFFLDDLGFTEDLSAYVIRGKGQAQYLARTVPISPITGAVSYISDASDEFPLIGITASDPVPSRHITGDDWTVASDEAFVQLGDEDEAEVIQARISQGVVNYQAQVTGRGIANTQRMEIAEGTSASRVYLADASNTYGSFRFSPGPSPSTSRASGTWTKSDNWIDIIMCLLTSSAHVVDGLELTNYRTSGADAVRSNWSSLPVGIGIGVPTSLVNVSAMLGVRALYPYRFPHYVVGAPWKQKETFLEHITRWFLRPIGAFVTLTGGQFSIVVPRTPLEAESTTSIGTSLMLREDGDGLTYAPGIGARKDMTTLVSGVTYRGRGANGSTEIINVTSSDFAGLYGQRGYYVVDGKTIEIDAPGIVGSATGSRALMEELAMRRLWRFHRPLWAVTFSTDFSLYALEPGELCDVSCDELPNESTGARGWTSVTCQVVERSLRIDLRRGLVFDWKVIAFGPGGRFGRVSPSGWISHVSGNVCTIVGNVYTETDADLASLPITDADAFTADDVVALKTPSGASVTSTRQTVSSKTSTTLTLNGNFGGALAPGLVLSYAPSADATATQLAQYVYLSDLSTGTVGATSGTAWSYAG